MGRRGRMAERIPRQGKRERKTWPRGWATLPRWCPGGGGGQGLYDISVFSLEAVTLPCSAGRDYCKQRSAPKAYRVIEITLRYFLELSHNASTLKKSYRFF